MLYITTRNKSDAHTAHKTLTTGRGPCGGFYVPFQMPSFIRSDIEALKGKNFGQCVAEILNIFFNARYPANIYPILNNGFISFSLNAL